MVLLNKRTSTISQTNKMGVQDVPSKSASGPSAVRRVSQHVAYHHDGPKEPPLLPFNGQHGSHGCMPSDRSYAPLFPHQASYGAFPTGDAAITIAALTRKRKAPEADVAVIDLTGDSPPNEAPRRKRPSAATRNTISNHQDLHDDCTKDDGSRSRPTKRINSKTRTEERLESSANHAGKRRPGPSTISAEYNVAEDIGKKPKKKAKQDGEKRMRRWRAHAPSAYREVRDRALTQRMFALERMRSNDNPEHPSETISLAGTTGNVYTIVVDKVPSCDCPHARKGNQCKHIVYVLSRILRAPTDLEYQLAFTSSELRQIFANAPPLPSETADNDAKDGNRKPVEGECPICCVDFEPDSSETVVYCKASCGNNIHKDCFGQWAATKTGQTVTCPFCRAPWQGDEIQLKEVAKSGRKNAEGYVNVASQLGLSGRRDHSAYNSFWVRGRARRGEIAWDEDGVMDHEY